MNIKDRLGKICEMYNNTYNSAIKRRLTEALKDFSVWVYYKNTSTGKYASRFTLRKRENLKVVIRFWQSRRKKIKVGVESAKEKYKTRRVVIKECGGDSCRVKDELIKLRKMEIMI